MVGGAVGVVMTLFGGGGGGGSGASSVLPGVTAATALSVLISASTFTLTFFFLEEAFFARVFSTSDGKISCSRTRANILWITRKKIVSSNTL